MHLAMRATPLHAPRALPAHPRACHARGGGVGLRGGQWRDAVARRPCGASITHRARPLVCRAELKEKDGGKDPKPEAETEESLKEAFSAGKDFGKEVVLQRFENPVVDDRGLPIADALVCISASVFFSTLILAGGFPRPSWLVPAAWVPKWRSFQYVFPAVQHGSSMAICWTLGAIAGKNYEKAAYNSTRMEAFQRTVKSGAFATGLLIIANQFLTYVTFAENGLPPFPGETVEGDLIFARIQTELIADIVINATSLIAWRQIRWRSKIPGLDDNDQ